MYVRYRCSIGFLIDAEVLVVDDVDGPEEMLAEVLGPSHPAVQPKRRPMFPGDHPTYAGHALQWANDAISCGDELVSLPPPGTDSVVEIEHSDLWPEGFFIKEHDDLIAFERATHTVSPTEVHRLVTMMEKAVGG